MRLPQLRAASVRRTRAAGAPQRRLLHQAQCFAPSASPPAAEEVAKARAYCAHLVKTHDAPSHVLQTFVPPPARDAYLALRAFNIDVAQVADTTSTPTVGMMRMQFWRDTITKALAGTPPKEPVAILLAHAADALHARSDGKARLSKNWFHRVINTREQYLGNPPYPTLGSLESYAENTYSTLLYLTLSALPQASLTTDHIASHIGKAAGIAAVLRGIPFVAFPPPQPQGMLGGAQPAQGAVLLPLDVMAEAGVQEEAVFRDGAAAPGLRDAVFTVATRASDHLITAREMLAKLRSEGTVGHEFEHSDDAERGYEYTSESTGQDKQLAEVEQAFGVFMPAVATQSWLDRLQKADFDLFDPELRKVDWKLPWKAYWAYGRRTF
jgi:NADH dehydrogenase [ubiquinone] 1 alpha subcomplex assembly factor 6